MNEIRRARSAAVFCGSRPGKDPACLQAAIELGQGLARRGIRLIYGGGRIGMMGAVADAALAAGGEVIGVIPEFLTRQEVAHTGLSALHVTDSMHSRKQLMFSLSDAFVTLPGGFGTFDETVEIATWKQLRLHAKPVLICNIGGWADPFLAAMRACVDQGFAGDDSLRLMEPVPGVAAALARLEAVPASAEGGADRL